MKYYLVTIVLCEILSLLSLASSKEVQLLRDQSPQVNFVSLTLNDVDKVKVPLPDGAAFGRVSLVEEDENEPGFQLWRGNVTAGRGSSGMAPFSRRVLSKHGKADDKQEQTRTDEYGRPLYHLKSVEITARSGPYTSSCILTGHHPSHNEDQEIEAEEGWERRGWPRSWRKVWTQAVAYEVRGRVEHSDWVSDVWCVTYNPKSVKFLAEISPPIFRTIESTRTKSQPPEGAAAAAAATEKQGDIGARSTYKIIELEYKQYNDKKPFTYAFAKVDPDTFGSVGLPVKKAAQLYSTETHFSLVCRPILYDGWPSNPFYQGSQINLMFDFVAGAKYDPLTYAFYCDNREDFYEYTQRSFRTGWGADWTTALGP